MKRQQLSKFGYVTKDGRLIVDVNRLYRSRKVKETFKRLDEKLTESRQPVGTVPR